MTFSLARPTRSMGTVLIGRAFSIHG